MACVGKDLPLSFTSGYFLHCKDEEPAGVMTICLWDSVCEVILPSRLQMNCGYGTLQCCLLQKKTYYIYGVASRVRREHQLFAVMERGSLPACVTF